MENETKIKDLPRLYKRGDLDVNLDDYIKNALAEIDFVLSNSRLKEAQKQEVKKAYLEILSGIEDGTFTYKTSGGFNNTKGITNNKDGFDAYGIASGILGNVLRKMEVYEAPKAEVDSTKIKYEGSKTIGAKGLQDILGESPNLTYFINQDSLVDGKRGLANRIKLILDYINDIATEGNWDKYFTGYTEELKNKWFKDYEKYGNIDVNQNGILDENEYLGLSKLLGLNNIEELFSTGETEKAPSFTSEEEYLAKVHPKSLTTLSQPRIIQSDKHNYDQISRKKLVSKINGFSDDKLLSTIKTALTTPLNSKIKTGIPELPIVTNNYILCTALEIARRKNLLKQFSTDYNKYYIPIESNVLSSKGIGLVYQISPDGKHSLLEMNRYDIPYFLELWHNDFLSLVPSHKSGGVLRKFGTGGYLDYSTPYVDADDIYNISLLDKYDESTGKGLFKGFVGSRHDMGDTAGLTDFNDKFTDNVATSKFTTGDAITALETYKAKKANNGIALFVEDAKSYLNSNKVDGATLQSLIDQYNANVKKVREWQHNKQNLEYGTLGQKDNNLTHGLLYENYGKTDQDLRDILGSATYSRLALAFKDIDEYKDVRSFKLDGYDDNIWFDNAGYLHIGEYNQGNPTTSNNTPAVEEAQNTEQKTGQKSPLDTVTEETLPTTEEKVQNDWLSGLSPTLLEAGRLWKSLHTNRKVYDSILPSLTPVLKDTYERYSPVTGANSFMQLKNKQASEVLSAAAKPFTSDASLAAARMLQGLKLAQLLQTEGFLADDQEIKRTKAEALARLEDNMARRSEVANSNRAAINQANREKALLKATKLKSNWLSWDNFLKGLETRATAKFDENRALFNEYRKLISQSSADRWKRDAMKAADSELDQWVADNTKDGVAPDPEKWGKYTKYKQRKELVEDMYNAMLKRDIARIYGIKYTSPYTDSSYTNFIKWI